MDHEIESCRNGIGIEGYMASGPKKHKYSDGEWQARVNLAAAYRLTDHFNLTDLLYNHITCRVPGTDDQFLINEFGLGYNEITASNLVKIDIEGNVHQEGEHRINFPGYVIHSAVHAARHDVACVMHAHTFYGMVVSALEDGLIPLQQDTYQFHDRVAYHEFEGQATDTDERERLVTDLGNKDSMILKNHGLLTVGRSVADAWVAMWQLERACQLQVVTQSTGQIIHQAPPQVMEKASSPRTYRYESIEWPWLLRTLDAKDPSYRN
jgi:ribulose-5-phosphate 4-epimerase/fuculose-1-phosphate aldolase